MVDVTFPCGIVFGGLLAAIVTARVGHWLAHRRICSRRVDMRAARHDRVQSWLGVAVITLAIATGQTQVLRIALLYDVRIGATLVLTGWLIANAARTPVLPASPPQK